MDFRRIVLFVTGCFMFSSALNAQNGYYTIGEEEKHGLYIKGKDDYTNSRFCEIRIKKKPEPIYKIYSPEEISSYCTNLGRVYVAFDVPQGNTVKRLFLEKLSDGKLITYYLKEKKREVFFVQGENGELIRLKEGRGKRAGYKTKLAALTSDCDHTKKAVRKLRHTRSSIYKFAEAYNSCGQIEIKRTQYGVLLGSSMMQAVFSKNFSFLEDGAISPYVDNSIALGGFVDFSYKNSKFSMRSEILYEKHEYQVKEEVEGLEATHSISHSTWTLPFLVRYCPIKGRLKPFVNIGMGLSFLGNIKVNSYFVTLSEDIIRSEPLKSPSLNALGGVGCLYHINPDFNISFELRYQNLLTASDNSEMQLHGLQLLFGVSIN